MRIDRGFDDSAAMIRYVSFAVLLGACSIAGIHYPDHQPDAAHVDCEQLKLLPVLDTIAAGAAFSASAIDYGTQARTSPWPLAALVAGGWAAVSAAYGYHETRACRRAHEP